MNDFEKLVAAFAMLLLGGIGLAMTLCGGYFTFAFLPASFMHGDGRSDGTLMLFISVPSLLAGVLLIRAALINIRTIWRE